MYILLAALLLIPALILYKRAKCSYITGKKILIVGGSSGLGLGLAKLFLKMGNKVTITSRSKERIDEMVEKMALPGSTSLLCGKAFDCLDKSTFFAESFDFIFYCPGLAIPGFFPCLSEQEYETQHKLNYLGMINTLYHFWKVSEGPFAFIVASSTTALFPVPGYASYAPSKASIDSFFETARYELQNEGINLKILYCCSMDTPGLAKEDKTKPEFTKKIEYTNCIADPDEIAEFFVRNLDSRNALAYDWFTYFCMIRKECECLIDYIFYPLAVLLVFISRIYVRFQYSRFKHSKQIQL